MKIALKRRAAGHLSARIASALLLSGAIALTGCSLFDKKKTPPLPGERISVLDLQHHLEPEKNSAAARFAPPAAWQNKYWPQPGGFPGHAMQNMALNPGELHPAWQVSIGHGATDRLPLTAQPVVAAGRVYTVDRSDQLTSFDARTGAKIWTVDLRPAQHGEDIIGGGVSFGDGRLFATNGYNEVLSLDPRTGRTIWRIHVPTPLRAAPTVAQDKLYVLTLDNHLYALNAETGAQLWDYIGVGETAGLIGTASPAADADIVVPVFTSGEIDALRAQNGEVAWQATLADISTPGLQSLADIRGLPVIDKGVVFAVSYGGRLIALDERSGDKIWQRDIGSAVTPWLSGSQLFVMTTENELVSLNRDTGAIAWVRPLPRYKDEDEHKHPLSWTAPIMAGGRLIVAGTNGDLVEYESATGKPLRATHLQKSVTIDPLVADGILYVLTDDGTLIAYH